MVPIEETIGISFFDHSISLEDKGKMVQALVKPESEFPSKQVNLPDEDIKTKKISDFITKNTKKFFDILGISANFVEEHPNLWPKLPLFVVARKTVVKICVTNNAAERGFALMEEDNGLQTKFEDQT